jgi:hypothetical protein
VISGLLHVVEAVVNVLSDSLYEEWYFVIDHFELIGIKPKHWPESWDVCDIGLDRYSPMLHGAGIPIFLTLVNLVPDDTDDNGVDSLAEFAC